MRRLPVGALVAAAGLPALIVLPFVVSDPMSFKLARMAIFLIAILGLSILTGGTGQISLGHGALMALGGYTTAILVQRTGIPDYATIPLAGLLGGAAGFLFGLPALRLSGLYLALATFGIAVAMPSLIKKPERLTKASAGIVLPFHTGRWLYGVSWACAVVLLAVAWLLMRGRAGRAFRAVRDSEIAAAASGVNLPLAKTSAFAISAFYAAVAGSLYGIAANFVSPETFPIRLSLDLLVGTVVGGLRVLWLLPVGAAFLEFLPVWAADRAPNAPSVVYGAAVILIMLALTLVTRMRRRA